MPTTRWHEGQDVLVVDTRAAQKADRRGDTYEPQRGTIAKVGRTLVHVRVGNFSALIKFYADTGHENAGQYTGMYRIYTPEAWAEQGERERVIAELRTKYDVTLWRVADRLSLAALTIIRDTLEGELR